MTKKRTLTVIIVLALLVGGGYAYLAFRPQSSTGGGAGQNAQAGGQGGGQGGGFGRNNQAANNRATVDKGDLSVTVTATGSVMAAQTSNLVFDTSGIVTQVLVQQGQHVEAGQTLATVDDSSQQALVKQAELSLQAAQATLDKVLQPVDPNSIAIAQADVKAAQGGLASKGSNTTAADIAALQAKVAQAQSDYDYADKLMKDAGGRYPTNDPNYQLALAQDGAASFALRLAQLNLKEAQKGSPTVAAQANIELAKAKLAQVMAGPLQSDIDQAQASVVAAQSQVDQAKHQLAKTILVAPYAGVISVVNVKAGQPSGDIAMVITDVNNLYVKINVDESDITSIGSGQQVDLTFDALPTAKITGKVDRIIPIADATANVITYPVRVLLNASDQPIRAGMTANATFHVKNVTNVVRVPNNFLKLNRATGQATVNLAGPGGAGGIVVPVKIGVQGSDYTEIIQGLNPGDVVVLATTTGGQGQQGQTAQQAQQAPQGPGQ